MIVIINVTLDCDNKQKSIIFLNSIQMRFKVNIKLFVLFMPKSILHTSKCVLISF